MKSKVTILTIVGLLAGSLAVMAQTTPTTEAAPAKEAVADAGAPSGAPIPLIVMDEVPLTDAIKNLARQAGLNYMLDPKMNLGQPGPDGRPTGQTVSIRWENITAEQALMALLNNNGLQIVQDPKTKIARITLKDLAAPDPLTTKIIQLKYAEPATMVVSVQTAFTDKRDKVVADIRTSQLVVLATERDFTAIDELILRLDAPTKQVLIECKIYETSTAPKTMKGIDWSGTLSGYHAAFGNNVNGGQGGRYSTATSFATNSAFGGWITTITHGPNQLLESPGLLVDTAKGFNPAVGFLDSDGVSAVISFLNSDADTRIIATPRAVTLDNQPAVLAVTRSIPIFSTTAGTQGSPGGSSVTYSNVGTILNVTPRISANSDIQLHVVPEVSNDAGIDQQTVAGQVQQAHVFDVRRIDTQVLVPSGNTLVLGGLMSDDANNGFTKVPVMGDVPIVGFFFRSKSKQQTMRSLTIFITPTIVTSDAFKPTKTDFLNSKAVEKPFKTPSVWDSAKPLDWSDTEKDSESSETSKTARSMKTKPK